MNAEQKETSFPTMSDRIAEHAITMKAEPMPTRTDRAPEEWDEQASHFRVTLTKDGRSMSAQYSMGSGHLAAYIRERIKGKILPWHINERDAERALHRVVSVHDKQVYNELVQRYGNGFAPKAESVLDSLAMDASSYENARNFEDFAAEFGYDTDSRKAEAMYRACGDTAKELRHLLGRDGYENLLWKTERQ